MPIRMVVQRADSASLLLDNQDEWGTIGRGLVVHISFKQECTVEDARKAAATVYNAKLLAPDAESEGTSQTKPVSMSSIGGEVMIVPQASLVGKLKGKNVQYHGLVPKGDAEHIYEAYVNEWKSFELVKKVVAGTYGNRQGFKLDSPGPYSHIIEL